MIAACLYVIQNGYSDVSTSILLTYLYLYNLRSVSDVFASFYRVYQKEYAHKDWFKMPNYL